METWREHLENNPTHTITNTLGQLTTCDHGDFVDPMSLLKRNDLDALGYRPDLPSSPALPGDIGNMINPGAWKDE
jgi:hypothetical protein